MRYVLFLCACGAHAELSQTASITSALGDPPIGALEPIVVRFEQSLGGMPSATLGTYPFDQHLNEDATELTLYPRAPLPRGGSVTLTLSALWDTERNVLPDITRVVRIRKNPILSLYDFGDVTTYTLDAALEPIWATRPDGGKTFLYRAGEYSGESKGAGADGQWRTADDDDPRYHRAYTDGSTTVSCDSSAAGDDGLFATADDQWQCNSEINEDPGVPGVINRKRAADGAEYCDTFARTGQLQQTLCYSAQTQAITHTRVDLFNADSLLLERYMSGTRDGTHRETWSYNSVGDLLRHDLASYSVDDGEFVVGRSERFDPNQ